MHYEMLSENKKSLSYDADMILFVFLHIRN